MKSTLQKWNHIRDAGILDQTNESREDLVNTGSLLCVID